MTGQCSTDSAEKSNSPLSCVSPTALDSTCAFSSNGISLGVARSVGRTVVIAVTPKALVLSSTLMMNRDLDASATSDAPTWRPTVQSYRNLASFTATLAFAAGIVLALTQSFLVVVAIAGLVLAAAIALSLLITRRRVEEALADAVHPELGNWPGSSEDREKLRRAGRKKCLRSVAMAVVLGALGGFYPIIGEAFVGIGVGGAIGSYVIMVLVQRYEAAHEVTVFTPSKIVGASKRRFVFGTAVGGF
jgi:hypothetical protein